MDELLSNVPITEIPVALEYGILAILVFVLLKYFISKDKKQEQRFDEQQKQFTEREVKREEQYRERERILVAESARREEILKKESEKREKIIREESEKRENALLVTIESFSRTLKEISDTMTGIKSATTQMQKKINDFGNAVERINKGGAGSG